MKSVQYYSVLSLLRPLHVVYYQWVPTMGYPGTTQWAGVVPESTRVPIG